MHTTVPAKITSPVISLKDGYLRTIPVALIVGLAGIGLSLLASGMDFKRFSYIYLANYCFLLSIVVGCLFFVAIMHLTRAGWSVTLRRIAELYAACITPMFLLFLPILIPVMAGHSTVYSWVDGGWSVHDADTAAAVSKLPLAERPPIEVLKASYLNTTFFTIRTVAYFVLWSGMAWFFLLTSLKQDKTGNKKLTTRMQSFSAPFMILFTAVMVFSSFDYEMTLSPLWFSTMFPVYFFAGSVLSSFAVVCLTALWLQRTGRVTDEITTEHYHDLGKLMFAFVVFWGYIAFSQFLLIWYANIPEETFWYDLRINREGWRGMSILLVMGHLFIPFLALMGRTFKRNRTMLALACVLLLFMHWIDHYWLVMPQFNTADHVYTMNLMVDVPCTIGMIAMLIAFFCLIARDRPLVALQDPRLGEALNHVVH